MSEPQRSAESYDKSDRNKLHPDGSVSEPGEGQRPQRQRHTSAGSHHPAQGEQPNKEAALQLHQVQSVCLVCLCG